MRRKLTLILICVRHGINPFGRVAKYVDRMRQRFTDEEKERLIGFAESETEKKIWRLFLYEKARQAEMSNIASVEGVLQSLRYHKINKSFIPAENVFDLIIEILEEYQQYRVIGTVEKFKYLSQSEHNYDNCHNLTCRTQCEKDGYVKGIEEFAERLRLECLNNIYHEVWLHTILKIASELKGE